jgi:LuxR family maltose regulon positive regulatory protein
MTIVCHQLSRFPEFVSVGDEVRPPSEGGGARQPLIARDDLVACLDRMTARKVTIIAAPAGSGKTSLLRAWADRADRDLKFLNVPVRRDQHDAQPFWLDLLNAVRQVFGTFQEGRPAATPTFNGRAMVDRVLNELAEHDDRVVLVIDDAHELASTQALAQLARLLASLPPQTHAIVSTRRDLWLGLHRLRLTDELGEIRPADLRFTEAEVRELLDASGIKLSAESAALLHQRTEGWAAGLRPRTTCSPRYWTASPKRSSTCCCGPRCWSGSTVSWPTC